MLNVLQDGWDDSWGDGGPTEAVVVIFCMPNLNIKYDFFCDCDKCGSCTNLACSRVGQVGLSCLCLTLKLSISARYVESRVKSS